MLEMESYLLPKMGKLDKWASQNLTGNYKFGCFSAVQARCLMSMVQMVMEQLDKLETTPPQEPTPPKNECNPQSSQWAKGGASAEKTSTGARKPSQPFVCFKYRKEGHQRPQQQGN